jgi:hypothetical protein
MGPAARNVIPLPSAALAGSPRSAAPLTTEGQPPPSQQDSTFWRQSWHHQAERIQKRRWGSPVIAQSIGRSSRSAPEQRTM